MNKRIRQLAEQAGLSDAYRNFDHKYFAELIVQECAKIADKAEPYKASDLIKKHFGVEE
jgi:hypothetical protein